MLFRVAFFASILGGLVFGYNTDVISGAILFIRGQFHLTDSATESLISGMLWSGLVAVLLAGSLAERLGRKRAFILSAFLILVGPIISAIEVQMWTLELGRLILGFGLGINTVVAPLYLSEVAPAKHRGKILATYPCSLTAGGLLSNVVDIILAQGAEWRVMVIVGALPALIQLVGLFFVCESPTWYRLRGQPDLAKKTILELEPHITSMELNDRLAHPIKTQARWRELFAVGRLRLPLLVGLTLAAIEQATGIDSIEFYAPTLFEQAGIRTPDLALLLTIAVAVVGVAMTFLAVVLVDRMGRKPLLKLGLGIMALSLFCAGLGFCLGDPAEMSAMVIVSFFVYAASFNLSLGTLIWVLIPEIFSSRFRAKGVSLALLVNWTMSAIISQIFLSLVELLGDWGLFFLFASITLASYAFVQKYVKETTGREINSSAE